MKRRKNQEEVEEEEDYEEVKKEEGDEDEGEDNTSTLAALNWCVTYLLIWGMSYWAQIRTYYWLEFSFQAHSTQELYEVINKYYSSNKYLNDVDLIYLVYDQFKANIIQFYFQNSFSAKTLQSQSNGNSQSKWFTFATYSCLVARVSLH